MDEFKLGHIPLPGGETVSAPNSSLKSEESQKQPSLEDVENPGNIKLGKVEMDSLKYKPELFQDGVKMSQDIVDELFKDFLAKKMNQIENEAKSNEVVDSVEEMNKFLDAELSEIGDKHLQKQENSYVESNSTKSRKHKKSSKDKKKSKEKKSSKDRNKKHSRERKRGHTSSHSDSKIKQSRIDEEETQCESSSKLERNILPESVIDETKTTSELNEANLNEKLNLSLVESSVKSGSSVMESEMSQNGLNVPQRKSGAKQLSLKISTFSCNLITSGDRIEETGDKRKAYEEGEISTSGNSSAGTEDETEEEEDEIEDVEPSGTGSISDSDKEKHSKKKKKKKKKHKHKKKKKAKLKEKQKDENKDEKKHSPSRSRSPRRSKRSHSDVHRQSRSRSREKHRRSSGYHDRHREEDWEHQSHRKESSRSRSGYRSRSRSSEREVKDLRVKINKAKLRQIAIKNALVNSMTGQGPTFDLASIKAGGKSVNELTDLCKTISSKERGFSDYSTSDEEEEVKKSEDEDALIHHPFVLNSSKDIVMNIRNAKQLPTFTPQEKIAQGATLRLQFPVSSGSQHRMKESQWVPVDPTTTTSAVAKTTVIKAISSTTGSTSVTNSTAMVVSTKCSTVTAAAAAIDLASVAVAAPPPVTVKPEDKVFPDPPKEDIDISKIISQRLNAYRKLKTNPHDLDAMRTISAASKKASLWAQSKQLPGQFSGSTGAQIMSHQDLIGPDKKNQAWSLKYSVNRAAPVSGGIGMFLLQKMGWKMGEGLGKDNKGTKEPLLLDFKIDRKGLSSAEEGKKNKPYQNAYAPLPKDLSGKHPVSALTELCNKRRWGPPEFLLVHESGPDHKKNFIFKVVVNKVEYQPSVSSQTKKLAKSVSATVCLQSLGLLPRTATQ